MVGEAVNKALADCQLKYTDIEQAAVGYLFGSSCSGQRALYEIGMTGIPIYNVNNACASGSSAMLMMKQFIEAGSSDCCLAVGFEKMMKGSLDTMPKVSENDVMGENYSMPISVGRPSEPKREARDGHLRAVRHRGGTDDRANVRRCRSRAYGEVRHEERALRSDRLEESQTFGQ